MRSHVLFIICIRPQGADYSCEVEVKMHGCPPVMLRENPTWPSLRLNVHIRQSSRFQTNKAGKDNCDCVK